jgi:hypothetical protein
MSKKKYRRRIYSQAWTTLSRKCSKVTLISSNDLIIATMNNQATQVEEQDVIRHQNSHRNTSISHRSRAHDASIQGATSRSIINTKHEDVIRNSHTQKEDSIFSKKEESIKVETTAHNVLLSPPRQEFSPVGNNINQPMEDYANTKKLLVTSMDDEKTQFLRGKFE